MVSWQGDPGFTGYARFRGSGSTPGDSGFASNVYIYPTEGECVDAGVITRVQYNNAYAFAESYAGVTFSSGDVSATAPRYMTVTMFIAPASAFAPGVVPLPSQVRTNAVKVIRGEDLDSGLKGVTAAGNYSFYIQDNISALSPNTKYWSVLAHTSVLARGSTPSIGNDVPIGNIDVHARGLSFWMNRTPAAPVITEPLLETVTFAGSTIDLHFETRDPDAVDYLPGDNMRPYFGDVAGFQIQYAPRATVDNPTPVWIDLPIASTAVSPTAGRGWFIENSATAPVSDGARQAWLDFGLKIKCGSSTMTAGQGILPSGNWQIRLRTFDYGHSTPGMYNPIMRTDGLYTPSNYPAGNTSPWSSPVYINVSQQVPEPIPTSPVGAIAISEGTPVTLAWQYRNTAMPPRPQAARSVQIRTVGDAAWTTLVTDGSTSSSYLVPSEPTPVSPVQYMTDPGFESGTAGGWTTPSPNALNVVTGVATGAHPGVHTGTKALESAGTGSIQFRRVFALNPAHTKFSLTGWLRSSAYTQVWRVALLWRDASNVQVGVNDIYVSTTGTWMFAEIDSVTRPAGATTVEVRLDPATLGGGSAGDRIDDFSLVGSSSELAPAYALVATTEYEWRVRVTDTDGIVSNWSDPAQFWIVPPVQDSGDSPVPTETLEGAALGCGKHRVEVYRRGGLVRTGELTQVSHVDWSRVRDDISTAQVVISGWDVDCGNLLSKLQTWAYELVIFRDNGYSTERVWEGPITLLTFEVDKVTIDAKDVMAYPYRRIIKQAMNDSGKSPTAGRTVVSRAVSVIQNAMAPDDPNVLRYLTAMGRDDDSKQYRSLPPYSRTAFEEVDDMAANAGLDYTTVGRRIILWGTKHRIGTLPEFKDSNLGSPPIVSEYGMSFANRYAISDGNGVHGEATRLPVVAGVVSEKDPDYGLVEMLSSTWASDASSDTGTYTQEGIETVKKSFAEHAERSIADRWPPPVVVRVPDNTTLNPDTVLSIQHLVPGVLIPLRSTGTLRQVAANQKLDSVKVVEAEGKETISVVMSPFSRDDASVEVEES